jgi:hypothetical protein
MVVLAAALAGSALATSGGADVRMETSRGSMSAMIEPAK